MKFYCIEEEVVWDEQEQYEQYEYWRDYGGVDMSYDEFMEDALYDSQGCITEELDTEKIAANAKLVYEFAKDGFGFGGAAGKPDVEQFKYLKALGKALEQIVDEQFLRTIYEGV